MSTTNLYNQEAKEKMKDLAEDIDFTMLATRLGKKPFHAIPMSTKKVDELGNIWFLSGRDSQHNANIVKNNDVQLLYSKPSNMEFMVVSGTAHITTEKSILEELYGPSDDMWFDGFEDPNLSAIKVQPNEAHYWEPKHNKLVTLFKMGVSTITGNEPDLGEDGDLEL